MNFAQLADLILYIHVAFILAVVLPVPLFLVGGMLGWAWVRKRWVRLTHVLMIGFVVAESLLSIRCPLTVWEKALRLKAGQAVDDNAFIATWMHRLFFYQAPPWVFTTLYVAFGLVVVALWVVYPPRRTQVR
jgi:hypothetical protein